MSVTCCEVIAALEGLRLSPALDEYALHEAIAQAFSQSGVPYIHESPLAPHCRIDFLCGHVGVEVKRGRPLRSSLLRQLERYCACEQISSLVVVVERSVNLPRSCRGKPVRVLSLNRLWGVSLP
jgi:hypothetical protein